MDHCPCCGLFKDGTFQKSSKRPAVVICEDCFLREDEIEKWKVDDVKPDKEVKEFYDLWDEYSVAANCSSDKKKIDSLLRKYLDRKKKFVGMFLVTVDAEDGVSLIGAYVRHNWAVARVQGFVANPLTWNGCTALSNYGSVLEVIGVTAE